MSQQQEQFLILVRHGAAFKNERKQYGGPGTPLSDEGVIQVKACCRFVQKQSLHVEGILSSPTVQCVASGRILAEGLGLPVSQDARLQPIHLGVIEGLTEDEVSVRFPDVAERLAHWRAGHMEVSELAIPDAEDSSSFYERGSQLVFELRQQKKSVILVGTRSILIVVASVLLRRTPTPGGGYREIIWPPSGILCFTNSDDWFSFCERLSTFKP